MPDGTTRLKLTDDGTPIHHFMGCSTFSEYTVVSGVGEAARPVGHSGAMGRWDTGASHSVAQSNSRSIQQSLNSPPPPPPQVSEISCAKINDEADLETVCMLGCGERVEGCRVILEYGALG